MSVIGIVAEYNPFHFGHLYHIKKSREILGEDSAVICVMSGDFVQRGEAAAYSKFARAEAACRCGADLVIELPLPWSLSSAEGFARGAVTLLAGLGCTHLSFGSEAGEIEPLARLAEALLAPDMNDRVSRLLALDGSLSYAAARQRAAEELDGVEAKLLETPNNILAVEYLKAILTRCSNLQPVTIRRHGSSHDGEGGEWRSASELRAMLRRGEKLSGEIPAAAAEVFEREVRCGRARPDAQSFETAVLSRLRMLREEDFERLPDASDGTGRRLYKAAMEEPTLDAVIASAKSKRYAMSRIRRMVCCAVLGVEAVMTQSDPPYARILAANPRGCEHLRLLRNAESPILTKPAAVRALGGEVQRFFELGARAHDFYALGYQASEERRGGADWRRSPVILSFTNGVFHDILQH